MFNAVVQPMSKGRGRPPNPDGETKRVVKLHADLVDMIAWIVRIKRRSDPGYNAAELVEPLLRPQIASRYKLIEADVEKIKKNEAAAAEKTSGEE